MTTSTNGSKTATVETLTAEVRVLMVGNRQITLSVAKQLDRIDYYGYGIDAITPFGRIKTGATVTLDRTLPRRPAKVIPSKHEYMPDLLGNGPGTWHESYTAEPWLEVIGRSELPDTKGSLIIFEVDSRRDLALYSDQDPDEIARIEAMANLPLIVLAGLR